MTFPLLVSFIFMIFVSPNFGQTTPGGIQDSTIWTPYYLSSTTGYNFNENQERLVRQLQASFQSPYNQGGHNGNQNVQNYQNPFERQNRFDNRQNGQQYQYPSQFFQQRRGEQQNGNSEYPNIQNGQHPFGTQYGNQGRQPQPYEREYYQSTRTPQGYGIGQQQQIIQQFQQRQNERQGSRIGNQPQGYNNNQQQQQHGAYNRENQGGLNEYLKQVHQGMYGKKK
uniref:Uncharacterized protein n=1 Tax=Panagrolaimus sp. PS1159 TaxID=55785 RepID=A0AC35GS28_9BILA